MRKYCHMEQQPLSKGLAVTAAAVTLGSVTPMALFVTGVLPQAVAVGAIPGFVLAYALVGTVAMYCMKDRVPSCSLPSFSGLFSSCFGGKASTHNLEVEKGEGTRMNVQRGGSGNYGAV